MFDHSFIVLCGFRNQGSDFSTVFLKKSEKSLLLSSNFCGAVSTQCRLVVVPRGLGDSSMTQPADAPSRSKKVRRVHTYSIYCTSTYRRCYVHGFWLAIMIIIYCIYIYGMVPTTSHDLIATRSLARPAVVTEPFILIDLHSQLGHNGKKLLCINCKH